MATKAKGGKPQVELQVSAADKKKALETAISQIEKQYGKGAVMKLGQATAMQVDAISTGSLGLDRLRLSTLSTRSIPFTQRRWVSILILCLCPSRTPASRRLRSWRR